MLKGANIFRKNENTFLALFTLNYIFKSMPELNFKLKKKQDCDSKKTAKSVKARQKQNYRLMRLAKAA